MALGAIIDVDTTKAVKGVTGLSSIVKTAAQGLTTLGSGVSSVGRTLLRLGAVGVAVTAGIGLLASQAVGFEQQMAKVRSVMLDVEGKNMPALKRKAEELALATTFSASQVGEGMELMARAGFKTGEIIEGIGGVLAVAASEGIELSEASAIVSSTLKGMGLQADQTTRVADVLAVAATSTKSSISTLGLAMANASTTAKGFGLSLEDTVASVALMQDIGIDAAESGTALKTMLLRLASPSDKVKKKMNALGFQIQDAQGNMLPFQQVIGNLSEVLPKLGGNIDQAAFLTELFGLRGIKAGIALADSFRKGEEGLPGLITKLQSADGAAKAMAELKLDNLRDQIGLVGSSVEVLSSRTFGPFLEVSKNGVKDLVILLNEVAKGLAGEGTSAASEFGRGMAAGLDTIRITLESAREFVKGLSSTFEESIGGKTARAFGLAVVAVTALTIALTPVAIAVGTILVAFGALLTLVGGVVAAFATLGAPVIFATLAIAIGLVQAAVVALIPAGLAVAGAFAFMQANGGSVGQFLQITWLRVQHGWQVFRDSFVSSWDEIRAAFAPTIAILRSAFADVTAGMQQDSDQVSRNVVNIATIMGEVVVFAAKLAASFAFWGAVAVKVGAVIFRNVISPLLGGLQAGAGMVLDFVATWIVGYNDISHATTTWIAKAAVKFVEFVDIVDKAITGAANGMIAALTKVIGVILQVAQNPVVQMAMKRAGLDPTKAIATLTRAQGALQAARVEPLGAADALRDVQGRLKDALAHEARQRASASAPDVTADVTLEDKRKVCIENNLTVDGRDLAVASKEAEVELTERAGFSVTPWQKRQILERGATVLNPT
jgi:TP901 family phage tail tape measure protein